MKPLEAALSLAVVGVSGFLIYKGYKTGGAITDTVSTAYQNAVGFGVRVLEAIENPSRAYAKTQLPDGVEFVDTLGTIEGNTHFTNGTRIDTYGNYWFNGEMVYQSPRYDAGKIGEPH